MKAQWPESENPQTRIVNTVVRRILPRNRSSTPAVAAISGDLGFAPFLRVRARRGESKRRSAREDADEKNVR